MPVSIYPEFVFELDKLLLEFEQHDKMISAGVQSVGPASAYAEVWEWGNVRQTKPGPKTTLGTNPDGEQVWLTIQAPYGYIHINENQYMEVIQKSLAKVRFKGNTAREITEELEAAATSAMERIAKIIHDNAPVDSGTLADSFEVVKPGSAILDNSDSKRILILDSGE